MTDKVVQRRGMRNTRTIPIVREINPQGLMEDSLLNPGHRIMSINGKRVLNTRSIKKALSQTSEHVTFLAKTSDGGAATVVTTNPEAGTRSRLFDLYGTKVRARRIDVLDSEQWWKSMYDSARIGCNIGAITLCVVAVVSPVKEFLFLTQINWVLSVGAVFALANAPWLCRKTGAWCSVVQIFCNALVISYMLYLLFGVEDLDYLWFCALFVPLLVMMNLPTLFPDGGDDDKTCDEHGRSSGARRQIYTDESVRVDSCRSERCDSCRGF